MFSRPKKSKPLTFAAVLISPHYDDAVLSSCLPLIECVQKKQPALVVTIFTQGNSHPLSRDANRFLTTSQARSASQLFRRRAQEDAQALKTLGASIQFQHWGLIDGLFRTTRTGGLRYPSYDRLFSGRLHPEDAEVVDELQARLQVLKDQGTTAKTRIFAPIGIGHHADHLVTHLAVKRVFETVQWWADSPYHLEYISTARRLSEMPAHQSQTRLLTPGQAKRKQAALDHYKSQLPGLYQNGLNSATLLTETWYEISST